MTSPSHPVRISASDLPSHALALFKSGKDTLDIARHLGINEPRAARLVWFARCRELRKPAEFLTHSGVLKRIDLGQQI